MTDGQVQKDKGKGTTRQSILQMAKCQKTKTKILHDILSCRWPSARSTSTDLQEQSNATTGSAFFRFAILSFALSYWPVHLVQNNFMLVLLRLARWYGITIAVDGSYKQNMLVPG